MHTQQPSNSASCNAVSPGKESITAGKNATERKMCHRNSRCAQLQYTFPPEGIDFLAFLSCHAMQRLTTIITPGMLFAYWGLLGEGGALGARRWIQGEGESGRLGAWPATRTILISSVSFPFLG
eukprot:1140115-Pelagomonas_calceolata.AAC.3